MSLGLRKKNSFKIKKKIEKEKKKGVIINSTDCIEQNCLSAIRVTTYMNRVGKKLLQLPCELNKLSSSKFLFVYYFNNKV